MTRREPATTFRDTAPAVPTCPLCKGERVREWTNADADPSKPLRAMAECEQGHKWEIERAVTGKEQAK